MKVCDVREAYMISCVFGYVSKGEHSNITDRDTHRKLVNVFGTCPVDRNVEVVGETPQERWVSKRAAVVQNKGASNAKTTNKEIPHHPSSDGRII